MVYNIMKKFYNIFSSALYEDNFNLDCSKMISEILSVKKSSEGRIISNYNGWQSQEYTQVQKPFAELFDKIYFAVNEYIDQIKYEKNLNLNNYWFNVNSLGSFNRPHSHGDGEVCLSGVFYLSVPENSGNIVYNSPMFILPDSFPKPNDFNEWTSSTYSYIAKENSFLLFPSYLQHYVEPSMSNQDRISISFNYTVAR